MTPDNREDQQMVRLNVSRIGYAQRDRVPANLNRSIRQFYLQRILAQILVKFPLPERRRVGRGF